MVCNVTTILQCKFELLNFWGIYSSRFMEKMAQFSPSVFLHPSAVSSPFSRFSLLSSCLSPVYTWSYHKDLYALLIPPIWVFSPQFLYLCPRAQTIASPNRFQRMCEWKLVGWLVSFINTVLCNFCLSVLLASALQGLRLPVCPL